MTKLSKVDRGTDKFTSSKQYGYQVTEVRQRVEAVPVQTSTTETTTITTEVRGPAKRLLVQTGTLNAGFGQGGSSTTY